MAFSPRPPATRRNRSADSYPTPRRSIASPAQFVRLNWSNETMACGRGRDVRGFASLPVARLLFGLAAAAVAVAAFLRGNYLLGLGWGILYGCITLALFSLLARSRTPAGSVARWGSWWLLPCRRVCDGVPGVHQPGRADLHQQAGDRPRGAGELAGVFASDPAYRDLSVSSVHVKVVNIRVHGSLGTRSDLDRLRSRIAEECPALRRVPPPLGRYSPGLRATADRVRPGCVPRGTRPAAGFP